LSPVPSRPRAAFAPFALGVVLATLTALGCSEEKTAKTCAGDGECGRGTVCDVDSRTCKAFECASINDCTGSRRTCLLDTRTCSAQECSECPDDPSRLCCASAAQSCILEGPNRYSCTGDIPCADDVACGVLGEGATCCSGICKAGACTGGDALPIGGNIVPSGDAAVPVGGEGGAGGGDGGAGGASGPDMGAPPANAGVCTPCDADADCAALGDGAECKSIDVGQFCTRSCAMDSDCPSPFVCKSGINLCLPTRVVCGCFATGCDAGEICDPATSQCVAPKPACAPCAADAECAAGLACGAVGAARYCLPECGAGCAAGTTCTDGACVPDSGTCDACLGACGGATPVCVPGANGAPAACAECGNGRGCAEPSLRCSAENRCVAPEPGMNCVTDNDCAGGRCIAGQCRECIEDRDCGAGRGCNEQTFACEDDPCGGLTCQSGSVCDIAQGRCAPGCMTDEDCGDASAQFCDAQTGQCFNRDGSCDDVIAVCAVGSVCQMLIPGFPGNCTCEISNPADPLAGFCNPGDVVACPPGLFCSYFEFPGQPPPPVGTCGPDIIGLCGGP